MSIKSNDRAMDERLLQNEESQALEIYYNVKVEAKVKKEMKTILHRQTGLILSESFTAILGPSGSGKTTLLNFLSARLMSSNLTING